jgi:hypothetical protein
MIAGIILPGHATTFIKFNSSVTIILGLIMLFFNRNSIKLLSICITPATTVNGVKGSLAVVNKRGQLL